VFGYTYRNNVHQRCLATVLQSNQGELHLGLGGERERERERE
jgi:hypothetical protein